MFSIKCTLFHHLKTQFVRYCQFSDNSVNYCLATFVSFECRFCWKWARLQMSLSLISQCWCAVLKCWKVAKPQFSPMSVNGPYPGNLVFKLDGIKCIWWRTNGTNQRSVFLKQTLWEIFSIIYFSMGYFYWHSLYNYVTFYSKCSIAFPHMVETHCLLKCLRT